MIQLPLLDAPLAATLGWAIIHSLWQSSLIALLLALALQVLDQRSSNLRYAVACAALLLIVALPIVRVALISQTPTEMPQHLSVTIPADPANPATPIALNLSLSKMRELGGRVQNGLQLRTPDLNAFLPWLTVIWSLGVIVCSLRLFGGWLYARRLTTSGTRQIAVEWQRKTWILCRQLRLKKPIRLLESSIVAVPTAIGWLRPVILLPVSTIAGLTSEQLEAILAHELAHIRRHDYLVNLLQAVAETLFFYHPATWWVSRQIRNEREVCCDDLAVEMCGNPLTYARALLELEQLRAAQPQFAMAANGGLLMNRIQRLTKIQPGHTDRFSGLFAGLLVIAAIVTAGVALQIAVPSTTNAARLNSIVTSIAVPQSSELMVVRPSASMSAPSSTLMPAPEAKLLPVSSIASSEPLLPAQEPTPPSATGIAALRSSNPADRAMAACQLGRMGAVEAIPALINLLSDATPIEPINCWASGDWSPARETLIHPTPGEQAAIALASLGQPAVDALIAALGSTNTSTRTNAAWAIGELRGGLGTDREAAVEPLIVALADSNASVRVAAAFSLGETRPRIAVNPLLAALLDADVMVREMAANALGEMKARAAVDGLSALLLRDESERVRRRAASSLGEIKDAGALDALTAALNDIDHKVRSSVQQAIGEIRD